MLLGRDVVGETALEHLEALVVGSLRSVEVLAELRASALKGALELGLARLESGDSVRDTALEARVDCGSAIIEISNALLQAGLQSGVLFAKLALTNCRMVALVTYAICSRCDSRVALVMKRPP